MSNKDFKGDHQVAIVTGGTTGIGGATSRELSQHDYRILMVALSDPNKLTEELTNSGATVHFLEIDLADSQNAAKVIIAKALELWGRIDLLVNCAGTLGFHEVADVTNTDWDQIFAVNLKAPFFLMQQAISHLKVHHGSIINVSSIYAWNPAKKNHLYDSLKAALNNLTRGFALEFRESGVRVNAIMPGGVRTPLVDQWLRSSLGREPKASDLDNQSITDPVHIAKVIVSLASNEMAWVNGVELPVDGGYRLG